MARQKHFYRQIYWHRIVIFITSLSLVACGVILYFVYAGFPSGGTVTVGAQGYYYVSVGRFGTMAEARAQTTSLRNSGGAGYVLNGGEEFFLAAAAYPKKSDAEKVAARLNSDGVESEVYPLEVAALKIKTGFPADQAKELAAFFSVPREMFETVYRLSGELDGGVVTESYAVLTLGRLRARLADEISRLSPFDGESAAAHVRTMFSGLMQAFSDAADFTYSAVAGVNIKYLLCYISDAYRECAGSVRG